MELELRRRRLRWLGHVRRMNDERIPKRICFGWMRKTRPLAGPRKRWRFCALEDLDKCNLKELWSKTNAGWCTRSEWFDECNKGLKSYAESIVQNRMDKLTKKPITKSEFELTIDIVKCSTCGHILETEAVRLCHRCQCLRSSQYRRPTSEDRKTFSFVCPHGCGYRGRKEGDLTRHLKLSQCGTRTLVESGTGGEVGGSDNAVLEGCESCGLEAGRD